MIETLSSYHLPYHIGTNRDRSELFVAAVRSSSGDTVPIKICIYTNRMMSVHELIQLILTNRSNS